MLTKMYKSIFIGPYFEGDWRWAEFIIIAFVFLAIIITFFLGINRLLRSNDCPPQALFQETPMPGKIKLKVGTDGKLVMDIQEPGTVPSPQIDLSEWQSSLETYCRSQNNK